MLDHNKPQQIYLSFSGNKVRWLSDSKVSPTNVFAIGSGESFKRVSLWRTEANAALFEPRLLCESDDLDGDVTELKTKSSEELLVSTSNGTISYFRYSPYEQKLSEINRWSHYSTGPRAGATDSFISGFDFDAGLNELCYVCENGTINLIRFQQPNVEMFKQNQLCSLNSVLYLKQFEIAVADSLGRVKVWDTRSRDNNQAAMTLAIEGECSPISCMANHPNQQHMVACGNLNGLLFIYDVRSSKKPFIMCHAHSQPVVEVCFNPFSCENIMSCSYDGSLWYWDASTKSTSNWDDRNINAKNVLPGNKYCLNSFDVNNETILTVNNNYGIFRVANLNLI